MRRNQLWGIIAACGGAAFAIVAIANAPGIAYVIVAIALAAAYSIAGQATRGQRPGRDRSRDRIR